MSTNDPLGLLGVEHRTAGGALGRIEQRGQPANRSKPTDDARRLADALADLDDELTDDLVFQVGRELGYTAKQTEAAARSALRSGLVEPWD